MFTGIIEQVGTIESLDRHAHSGRLRVRAPGLGNSLKTAGSIAVNGCCLTIIDVSGETFAADLSAETLCQTSFGQLTAGARVNLERPLTVGKELGGHFVQGHIDGVGRVARLAQESENWWLSVRVPADLGGYIASKGSIAIDGISLTVAHWRDCVVDVAIVPFTYAHTNLSERLPGDAVNIECDILAKYVERLTESSPARSTLTIERLREEGF